MLEEENNLLTVYIFLFVAKTRKEAELQEV